MSTTNEIINCMITYINTVDVQITKHEMSQLSQQDWDYLKPWISPVDIALSTLSPIALDRGQSPTRELDRINLLWQQDRGDTPWFQDSDWRQRPLEISRHGEQFPNTVKFWKDYWQQQGSTLGRAFLSRIPPACKIYPHVDAPWSPDPAQWSGVTRYGVVIETNPDCLLTAGNHSMHVEEGTMYYFDKSQLHSATNNGTTPRTHLYMDVFESKND